MRLRRLDLTRYGKFTDLSLDFGDPAPGEPDLHIVYGPNEAGKSTMLAGVLDLLFGIETRSAYGFLHPYPTMRLGASLDLGGTVRDLVRIKRPQRSLLDRSDEPVPDGLLARDLGGIDREGYRAMFSLDDETLEDGGNSILASEGDLGQLLFSASSGLAALSQTLVRLRTDADGFYKFRGKSGELADLKAKLAGLKEERERIDTFAVAYRELVLTRDRASAQYEDAVLERGRSQSRIDAIRRSLAALPRLSALRTLRERLRPLAGLPEAPPGWLDELPTLQTQAIELSTRAEGLDGEIAQITGDLAAMTVDETALAQAARVDALADLRARYVTADKDLPERRLQVGELDLVVAGALKRLDRVGEPDPASLLLPAATVGVLRALIEARSGLDASLEAAQSELLDAGSRLDEARDALARAGGKPEADEAAEAALVALAAALAAARSGDQVGRRKIAERAIRTQREALAQRMASLRPWAGSEAEFAAPGFPEAAAVAAWTATLAEAERRIERHREEIDRLDAERLRLDAEQAAIGASAGAIGDADAAALRLAREAAWADHRRALDPVSAAAFEAALRRDDGVTDARLKNGEATAWMRQAAKALARLTVDLGRAREGQDAAAAARQAVLDEVATALAATRPALPVGMTVAALAAWLDRREKALRVREALVLAEADLREADLETDELRRALGKALDRAGSTDHDATGLDTLSQAAQAMLDRQKSLAGLRAGVRDALRDQRSRERTFDKATRAAEGWRASWTAACSTSWLEEIRPLPGVPAVREVLAVLADLAPALDKRASLHDRIRKMQDDQAAFGAEVAVVARAMGLEAEGAASLDLARRIEERVRGARLVRSAQAAKTEALADARTRRDELARTAAIHARRCGAMLEHFGVGTLAEVGTKLQETVRRKELAEQADAAERDILDALDAGSIEAAEAELDAADRTLLETELAAARTRLDDQDQRVRELFSTHSKAADRVEAIGGDEAAARLEERRRTTLLDIEDKAVRYLRLRIGIVAAEQALRGYRDKHRSSMMTRASDAFRTISRGAYAGLATQPSKEAEVLIAVAANGPSKVASDLSKGTRFQLYLALRMAGYLEFVKSRSPVPFLADDIMETFDDFRAEEVFRLFADMARVGQVIYLTHHRHLRDIARSVCPQVRVHELPSPPAA